MYNIDIQSPEFVKCLEQGKQEAFQQLFETFHKALCFFAARIVRDHLEAEDIVQDVFLRTYTEFIISFILLACFNHLKSFSLFAQ